MKFIFIALKEVAFPVQTMCHVLEVSRSGYYAWQKRPEPAKTTQDAQLTVKIAGTHKGNHGIYPSPRCIGI